MEKSAGKKIFGIADDFKSTNLSIGKKILRVWWEIQEWKKFSELDMQQKWAKIWIKEKKFQFWVFNEKFWIFSFKINLDNFLKLRNERNFSKKLFNGSKIHSCINHSPHSLIDALVWWLLFWIVKLNPNLFSWVNSLMNWHGIQNKLNEKINSFIS